MKNLFTILLFLIGIILNAQTYYHISNTGNDITGNGSITTPYATIAKVNSLSPAAGDSIVFKCGDTWREQLIPSTSGTSGSYINYGKYSIGSNPIILGSNTTTWDDQGSNIWKSHTVLTDPRVDYNVDLCFNSSGTIHWGINVANTGSLTTEYQWTWSANYVYIYAVTDPDSRYTTVEIPQRISCIDLNNKDYLSFNGLDLHYATYGYGNGITPEYAHIGLLIQNSVISYIGGNINSSTNEVGYGIKGVYSSMTIQSNQIFECGRRAIDFHIYGLGFTIGSIIVQDNIIHDCYHTTGVDMSVGSSGYYTASIDGVIIRRNIMYNTSNRSGYTSEGMFIQNSNSGVAGAIIRNIYVYSNIFKYPDNSSIHIEHGDYVYIYNNTFYEVNTTKTTNCFLLNVDYTATHITVKNNIFYSINTNNYAGLCIYINSNSNASEITADYNIYYRINNSVAVIKTGSTNYYMNQLTTVRSVLGWEIHGQFIDPTLTSTTDYHLLIGSPAISAGIGVGVSLDYSSIVFNSTPSVGAYEYNGTVPGKSSHMGKYLGKIGKYNGKILRKQ